MSITKKIFLRFFIFYNNDYKYVIAEERFTCSKARSADR